MSYQHDWFHAVLAGNFRGTCSLPSFVVPRLYSVVGFEGREQGHRMKPGLGCSAASRLCSLGLPAPSAACTVVCLHPGLRHCHPPHPVSSGTGKGMAVTCTCTVSRWSVWTVQSSREKRKVRVRCDLWDPVCSAVGWSTGRWVGGLLGGCH